MKIWLVLTVHQENVGSRTEETPEYKRYWEAKQKWEERAKENDGWMLGFNPLPPEPKKRTHEVPLYHPLPRIVEISVIDPTIKYQDRIFNQANQHKPDAVWIDELRINDNGTIAHGTYIFDPETYVRAIITDTRAVAEIGKSESMNSAEL